MATYVTPCVQGFPSIQYYYSELFIGYVNEENSVTKLARIGDHRGPHHTIKLSF
ncbi:hypothetical protein F383_21754 [Gossypium arboreum]|uniref:Uncharacterized protein n=1 Tax=Gossypium arboreum TaxID=29729 RepID=A0A0B0P2E1_GOSAR|nr:hypothetical protein F383_21754 [Gossypium arboreum]